MNRLETLKAAAQCVCGDREEDYGSPEDNFSVIAALWTAYTGTDVTPKDVAMMMALLKIARARHGAKEDNFVDLAGYAACAAEISAHSAFSGEMVVNSRTDATSTQSAKKHGCTISMRRDGDGYTVGVNGTDTRHKRLQDALEQIAAETGAGA